MSSRGCPRPRASPRRLRSGASPPETTRARSRGRAGESLAGHPRVNTPEAIDAAGLVTGPWPRFHVLDIFRLWRETPENRGQFPLLPIIGAWQDRALALEGRHVIAPALMAETEILEPFPLARVPALLRFASAPLDLEVSVIEIDGEPIVSRAPNMTVCRRTPPASAGDLFERPRTLDGERIEDVLIEALADLQLTGDERSPLRSDIHKLSLAAFALTGAAHIPEAAGAIFLWRSPWRRHHPTHAWRTYLAVYHSHPVSRAAWEPPAPRRHSRTRI